MMFYIPKNGLWNKNLGDRRLNCYLMYKKNEDKKSPSYKTSSGEIEEHDFRV
jgi:hypothetical protein